MVMPAMPCDAARPFACPCRTTRPARGPWPHCWRSSILTSLTLPHLGSLGDDGAAQLALIEHPARHDDICTDSSGVRRFDLLAQAVRRAGPHSCCSARTAPGSMLAGTAQDAPAGLAADRHRAAPGAGFPAPGGPGLSWIKACFRCRPAWPKARRAQWTRPPCGVSAARGRSRPAGRRRAGCCHVLRPAPGRWPGRRCSA